MRHLQFLIVGLLVASCQLQERTELSSERFNFVSTLEHTIPPLLKSCYEGCPLPPSTLPECDPAGPEKAFTACMENAHAPVADCRNQCAIMNGENIPHPEFMP